MKYYVLFFLACYSIHSQNVTGLWKTVDGDGVSKSIVKIYESENNTIEGKVFRILKDSERDRVCKNCKGRKKNQPIEGLVIIEDMKKKGRKYSGGEITDPENGKTYNGKIWLDENDSGILHVRGYIAFFYRTQDWIRVKEASFSSQ